MAATAQAGPVLQLNVTPSNPTVAEGGTVSLTVTATGCDLPFADVTYTVVLEPLTATPPDFGAPLPSVFQFGFMGGFDQEVMVPTVQDALDEPDEAFRVRFVPTPGQFLECKIQGIVTPTEASTIVTISDDDPTPSLAIDDVTVTEGNAGTVNATFTATLSAPSGQTVTVGFGTADGTAAAGEDYQAVQGTLTFTPGVTSQSVSVAVNGDTDVEPDETFFVDLSSPVGATLADAQGQGTIENDDQPPPGTLSIDDVTVVEGDEGTRTALFTVTLSTPSQEPVGVSFATANGTAQAGTDYQATQGTLSFAPGALTRTIPVTVNGDTEVEPDETFFVNLSSPTGATLADGEGQGTIQNDDEAAPGTLSIDDVTVVEGDEGTTEAVFTVTLSTPSQEPVGVEFATADGTAAAGTDYQAAQGTLSFAPGATTRTIAVPVNGDTDVESDETFFVHLSNPTGATLADGEGQGTIQNDDEAAPGTLSIDDVTVTEGDAGTVEAVFTVTLSTASQGTVEVDFATASGTATAGTDFQAAQGTLSFAPGETEKTVSVAVVGDTAVEPDETFFVNLSNPSGATVADGQGQGTIIDDDEATPSSLSVGDVAVMEGDSGTVAAVFRVTLSPASGQTVSVSFATADGSATAGADYQAVQGALSFAPGETAKTISVAVVGDTEVEPDETFFVNLTNGGVAIADAQGRGLIRNDDEEPPRELERESEAESSAGPGQLLTVRVRVTENGQPAPGVVVTWSVEGDAELVGGDTSVSQPPDGIASKQVRLGGDAGQVEITAQVPGADGPVSFTIVNQGPLEELFGGDDTGGSVAGALDGACRNAVGELREFCDYLFGIADPGARRQAIDALIPTQVASQGTVANQAAAVQVGHLLARMKTVRKAARTASGDRVALHLQVLGVDAGRVRQALAQHRQDAGLLKRRLEVALASAAPNRAALALFAQGDEPPDPVTADDVSRWGFFLSGSVESGDRPDSERERGFDFDTQGLTAGFDYGLGQRWALGAAVGYLSTDTEFSGPGGGLDVEGFSLSAFATYYREAFYFETVASYGSNDYRQARAIELPVPFAGQSRFIAVGEPDGDQLGLALGLGHDFSLGAASLGAFGRLSYLDSSIDSYRESGAGPLALEIDRQELESLIAEVGVELTYSASMSWGVLLPQLRVGFLRELEDDSRLLRGRFVEDRGFNEFVVPTAAPDRDFFNVGAGLTATLSRGRTFFLFVDKDFSRDDLDAYRVAGGFRLEL